MVVYGNSWVMVWTTDWTPREKTLELPEGNSRTWLHPLGLHFQDGLSVMKDLLLEIPPVWSLPESLDFSDTGEHPFFFCNIFSLHISKSGPCCLCKQYDKYGWKLLMYYLFAFYLVSISTAISTTSTTGCLNLRFLSSSLRCFLLYWKCWSNVSSLP